MIGHIENPRIITSFQNHSKPYGKIESRKTHGFIFKIKGTTEYIIDGERVRVGAGDMIFLHEGLGYEYTSTQGDDNLYTSINFTADIDTATVSVYSMENFYKLGFIAESFSELWRFGTDADRYACMAVFYDMLSYIKNSELASDTKKKDRLIDPAVEYMRSHIYDCSFRVDRLHLLCGISDTYFRSIFKSRFGMSPKEYVLLERISHARFIIESGDYSTLREVAESVGFSDALYFSKVFRRTFGVCPSGISG